jgi:hypothetical protein
MKIMFEFKTFELDTILHYDLLQKLKLIKNGKFKHLINILTNITVAIVCKCIHGLAIKVHHFPSYFKLL